jgi:hypothetical protein
MRIIDPSNSTVSNPCENPTFLASSTGCYDLVYNGMGTSIWSLSWTLVINIFLILLSLLAADRSKEIDPAMAALNEQKRKTAAAERKAAAATANATAISKMNDSSYNTDADGKNEVVSPLKESESANDSITADPSTIVAIPESGPSAEEDAPFQTSKKEEKPFLSS